MRWIYMALIAPACHHAVVEEIPAHPTVTLATPADGVIDVRRDTAIALEVSLPNVGAGVDATTLTPDHVLLIRDDDHAVMSARVVTSGGGDVIVVRPKATLAPETRYTLQITDGVADIAQGAFVPFTSSFTTTSVAAETISDVAFDNVPQPAATGYSFTSLAIGPDGKLYSGTTDGPIVRYDIAADGTLSNAQPISTLGARATLGLAFDPSSTAQQLILWVTHGPPLNPPVPDWSDAVTRLSGPELATAEDVVVGLPHSIRDHATNSIAFGPDGALYIMQGSNTATGAPDDAWGLRPEHVLNAAVLRLDVAALTSLPLDVQTDDGGTYDPYATGAPLTLYATGVRNGFDLVWHSDGHLYVANNGSAAGGTAPATPATWPASCARRRDGVYFGPAVPAMTSTTAQDDYLYAIEPGRYYGHPDPARCEWVLDGGNPTPGVDPEQTGYPVGVAPDRNFAKAAFDFGLHESPDGLIEYKSATFGGALEGKLLVTRYSAGGDIIALAKASTGFTEMGAVPGLDGLGGPVDIVENSRDGSLYVSEYDAKRITLFVPTIVVPAPHPDAWPAELVASSPLGGTIATTLDLGNSGDAVLHVDGIAIDGAGAWHALLPTAVDIAPGALVQIPVELLPLAPDCHHLDATAHIELADRTLDVPMFGLAFGCAGAEPTLNEVLHTAGFPIDVGGEVPIYATGPGLVGAEVVAPMFAKAGDGPVEVVPLARFGPIEDETYGWFTLDGATPASHTLATMTAAGSQMLDPIEAPGAQHAFDPSGTFGLFMTSPSFAETVYMPDAMNTNVGHAARVFPVVNRAGAILPYRYVVAFEEATNGDYQDVVLLISNVVPIRRERQLPCCLNQPDAR